MTISAVDPVTALLEAVQELAPRIAAAAPAIERDRQLPEPLMQALTGAGLFRMLVPAALGGGEVDLATFARVVEAVARADGSTAWCLYQCSVLTMSVAHFLPREAAEQIYADPRVVVAWGPGDGTAVVVDGGYRLTGKWSFASGCHNATWLGGNGTIQERDGSPRTGADGKPQRWLLMLPASNAQFLDAWDVSGLRGTNSDSYTVTDLFISAAFACPYSSFLSKPEAGPLGALPSTATYGIGAAGVVLGLARATLDAFAEFAAGKTRALARNTLRDSAVVQAQLGRADAELRAARAYLHEAIASVWAELCATGGCSLAQRVLLRSAITHAMHTGARVVDTIYNAAGASAIQANQPFERRWRDVHAATQHPQGDQAHFEVAGKFLLGLSENLAVL